LTLLESLTGQQTKNVDGETIPRNVELLKTLIGPGPAGLGLQVVVGKWNGAGAPTSEARAVHSQRLGKRIFPLVVALSDRAGATWIMGPSSDATPVGPIPESQAVRLLQAGLDEPSGIRGRQRIASLLRSFQSTEVAGMTNSGLFATHFLTQGVKETPIWAVAAEESKPWLGLRGEQLISAMGFSARRAATAAHVLTTTGSNEPRAIAVLLSDEESFDSSSARFAVSPVAFGLNLAQREGAGWLMVLRGPQIRVYPAKPGVGVGSRGLAETFFELDLALLSEEDAGFLGMVFSANALAEKGSINYLLENSSRYATGLGIRLRQRVYEEVVPTLSLAVADQLKGQDPDLDLAYRITLRILFRLLFQAYAEDRGLLPYGRNERYTRNSLKRWARDFVEQPQLVDQLDVESHAIWDDLRQVWGVIDTGNKTWDVPAYNGGLFGSDAKFHPEGALIEELELDDEVTGSSLRHLLVDVTPDGTLGPVDFRSLSVREFGTIYEGLLESSLSRTDVDLTIDKTLAYVPAKKRDDVVVPAGRVYFHNKSGERKATGSYFTPSFAVAHLLEHALEPTLRNHLDQVAALLDTGDQAGAQDKFFDFRIADLAMGSGHFLVAAVDTIEAAMSTFLTDHNLPGVTDELRRLEEAARAALGDDEADYEIEPSGLLRRQIARRCIYGLDINEIAVELARVGIWIHTFVPGLPMSSLDHTLVCANSLTGIGTVDEALDALEPQRKKGMRSILAMQIEQTLVEARQLLVAAANTSEASKAEVAATAQAAREAAERAFSAKLIFDAAVAARTGMLSDLQQVLQADEVVKIANDPVIRSEVAALQPGHMPYLFPEVFLRDNPGFDCVLGNPPWEEVRADPVTFWTLRFPGLRGMTAAVREREMSRLEKQRPNLIVDFQRLQHQTEAMRRVILSGPYPGIGTGRVDLYKAFAWRFLQLVRDKGRVGVVLPRSALSVAGTTAWREAVLEAGTFEDVCFLTNTNGWVFPEIHQQYTVALTAFSRGTSSEVAFNGPFHSLDEYLSGRSERGMAPKEEFATWSDTFSFPRVPDAKAGLMLRRMKRHPASIPRTDSSSDPCGNSLPRETGNCSTPILRTGN